MPSGCSKCQNDTFSLVLLCLRSLHPKALSDLANSARLALSSRCNFFIQKWICGYELGSLGIVSWIAPALVQGTAPGADTIVWYAFLQEQIITSVCWQEAMDVLQRFWTTCKLHFVCEKVHIHWVLCSDQIIIRCIVKYGLMDSVCQQYVYTL